MNIFVCLCIFAMCGVLAGSHASAQPSESSTSTQALSPASTTTALSTSESTTTASPPNNNDQHSYWSRIQKIIQDYQILPVASGVLIFILTYIFVTKKQTQCMTVQNDHANKQNAILASTLPASPSDRARSLADKLFPHPRVVSARTDVVNKVHKFIISEDKPGRQTFLVLVGPQGVGKTTAIETALAGKAVITITEKISPGTCKKAILKPVLCAIVGKNVKDEDLADAALQVIKNYHSIFRKPLLVVIQADQRAVNEKPAHLSEAARELVELYKLRVIIDASDNAMPANPGARADYVYVEPMTDELLSSLSTFKGLVAFLKEQDMLSVVIAVCGGRPSDLWSFNKIWLADQNKQAKVDAITEKIVLSIEAAIKKRRDYESVLVKVLKAEGKDPAKVSKAFQQFKSNYKIEKADFTNMLGIEARDLPDYKEVFRCVNAYLVPATGAMASVLRADLRDTVSYETIKNAVSITLDRDVF